MPDQIMWWLFTHVQQVQTAAWTLAAIGVLAVLVGLAGIGLDRLRQTAALADEILAGPASDDALLDLADIVGVRL